MMNEIIEGLARSAKLELQLSKDTLLCLECCKIVATFIENKLDLINRIEKAMARCLDDENNVCNEETTQDLVLYNNVFEEEQSPEKKKASFYENFSESEIIMELDNENYYENAIEESSTPANITTLFTSHEINLESDEMNINNNFQKNEKEEQAIESDMEKTVADEQNPFLLTHEEKNFKCDVCSFAHSREINVILHQNIHKGLKENQCPYCLKFLSSKTHCIRHMETTHSIFQTNSLKLKINQEYQCDKCGLCLPDSESFKNHKMEHDAEENPLYCSICEKSFKTIKTHQRHMATHHEDRTRRYTCEHCGKIFVDKYTHIVHLCKIHKKENQDIFDTQKITKHQSARKKVNCIICNKSFGNKKQLDTHMENKHDVILNT